MNPPDPRDASVGFAERLLEVIDSGRRTATYKLGGVAALALRGALDLISHAGGGVVEGYPHDMSKQPEGKKMSSSFLYNGTRRMYEEAGFTYQRSKGQKNCVMIRTIAPA